MLRNALPARTCEALIFSAVAAAIAGSIFAAALQLRSLEAFASDRTAIAQHEATNIPDVMASRCLDSAD